jgi:hypothetical protein
MISFRMINMLFIYIIYNNIFRNYSELNYHVKCDHQSLIKIKFQNDDVIEVKRAKDNIFKYKYGKIFKFPNSLYKHVKRYNNELIELEENEEERVLMNILEDFDASESMNMNEKIIPIDCFDALISYENC